MIRVELLILGLACVCSAEWFPVVMESIPYPVVANAAQITGVVRLKMFLNSVGTVERSEVLSGNKVLAEVAQNE